MKCKICFLICNFLWIGSLFAQMDELTLTKGTQEKTISLCDCVDITIHSKVSTKNLPDGSLASTGYIQSMSSDSIYFMAEKTVYNMKHLNGNKWTKEVEQLDERTLIVFAVKDVSLIEHRSKGREFFWGMSSLGIVLSALTTLIVSPIVGYRFKDGLFDLDRYKDLLFPSLGVLGGSTLVHILARSKKYYFQKEGLSTNDLWVIQVK